MRHRHAVLATLALLVPLVAIAANVHFVSGPTVTQGERLTVCGTLAGLGNQNITVSVEATANVVCTNRGGNDPPGQKQSVSGSASDVKTENGRASFCVSTSNISNPCPKGHRPSVTYSEVRVTVTQGGRVVYRQTLDT